MLTVLISLFFGASLVTSVALAAACILAGKAQETAEAEPALATVESLHAIAEVELAERRRRRRTAPVHVGI